MTVPVVQFTVKGQPAASPLESSAGASGVGMGRPYTLIYDGQCKVCGKLVKALRKWDARSAMLEIIPSQTPGLHARFPWIPTRAYLESVQLVGPHGQTWQGAAAVEHVLDAMPKGGLLTWVFSIPFARPLAERFYRWFARNRYRLGCGSHCTYRELSVEFGDEEAAAAK